MVKNNDVIEKAVQRKVGDMHPNGKWVWRASANGGKGDWRVAKPSRGGGAKKTAVASTTSITQKQDDNTPAAKSPQTAQKQANKPSNDEAAKLTEKELEIAEDGSVIDFIYTDDEGNKEKEHYEKTNLQWYGRNANGTRVAVSESYLKVKISRRIQKDEIKVNLKMPKYASKQTDDSNKSQ